MSGIVVHDNMDIKSFWDLSINLFEEVQELVYGACVCSIPKAGTRQSEATEQVQGSPLEMWRLARDTAGLTFSVVSASQGKIQERYGIAKDQVAKGRRRIGIHGSAGELPEKLCGPQAAAFSRASKEPLASLPSCKKLSAAAAVERLWLIVNI
jgi:hypothetical protein